MRLGLVLVVVFAFVGPRLASGAVLATLRAVDCCANDCHKEDPIGAAKRCCILGQPGSEAAALTHVAHPEPPLLATAVVMPVATRAVAGAPWAPGDGSPHRAGPLFLLTASLRL